MCNHDNIIENSASIDAFAKTLFHALFTLHENKIWIVFGFQNKSLEYHQVGNSRNCKRPFTFELQLTKNIL